MTTTSETMQAIIVDPSSEGRRGPEALRWQSTPVPTPAAGEVLVEVIAAGVNRADLMQRQGHYPPPPGASTIIGLECSGRVAAVGDGVSTWSVGRPCVALLAGGGYAEYVAVPAGQLLPVPDGVDPITAAGLIEVAATVWSNLSEADLRGGETVLIHGGAGGIGAFAIQWAKHLGATVHATAGTTAKREICRELGADHVWDHRDAWDDQVAEVGPVDVILDPIGAKYLARHQRLLARDGRLIIIGMQGGRTGEVDLAALLSINGTIRATSLRGRPTAAKARICAGVRDGVWPGYADGSLRLPHTTTIPMPEAARAHTLAESGDSSGKIILTVPGRT